MFRSEVFLVPCLIKFFEPFVPEIFDHMPKRIERLPKPISQFVLM